MLINNRLNIVIPCYNEEEVINITIKQVLKKISDLLANDKIDPTSRITLVDDGSTDKTWEIIKKLSNDYEWIEGIKLSKNRGHQNALLAGLMTVKDDFDMVISMDADLQDDVDAVDGMIEAYTDGAEIVYGVRSSRKKDSLFKKSTALGFYKLMKIMGVDIVYNHADYRLLSKRALDKLAEYKEVNLFLRGIVPMIGYKTATVTYERNERVAGESKYPLKRMLEFALEGITSCSVKPLRMITTLGVLIFFISIIYSLYFMGIYFLGKTVAGWTTVVISVWILGGLQLFAIGMVGEYIGKIYLETKSRPKYIIDEYLQNSSIVETRKINE